MIDKNWDGVIIDGAAVHEASSEALQYIADAYWRRGLIIVGINMDRSTFRQLVGSCSQSVDKPVWWESDKPYFILSSRLIHALYEADLEAKIGELTKCLPRQDEDTQGYISDSNFAAAYFLNSDEEFDFLYANLTFALENVLRSRMNYARYLAAGTDLTTSEFVEIFLSQGMSQAAILQGYTIESSARASEVLNADGYQILSKTLLRYLDDVHQTQQAFALRLHQKTLTREAFVEILSRRGMSIAEAESLWVAARHTQ